MTNPSSPKSQQTISLTNQEVINNLFFVYSLTKQPPEKIVFSTKLNFGDFKNLVINLAKNSFITIHTVNTSGVSIPLKVSLETLENNLNTVSDFGYLAYIAHKRCPFMFVQYLSKSNQLLLKGADSNTKNVTNNLVDLWFSIGNTQYV